MRVGSSKMAIFAYLIRYILRTFTCRSRAFALKSVSGSATCTELTFLAFGQNCSKICRATHILSATKMYPMDPSF